MRESFLLMKYRFFIASQRLCADSLRKHILVIFAVNEKSYDL